MPRSPLRVASQVTLESRAGPIAGKRWIDLLEQIDVTHSISAAARAINLSYKAAWDAVEAMNNVAGKPLVERSVGGKGGGGAALTPRGRELLATYRAAEAENARFLEQLNARIKNAEADLRIIGRLNMLTSARNHFSGTVTAIKHGAVNDEVRLALPGGEQLTAIVTHASAEHLGLAVGSDAIALIKASWVLVAVDDGKPMKLSARNQLRGKVQRLTPGAVNTEVVIDIGGGTSIAAIITKDAAESLKLALGKPAIAIFKASSVILGANA